MRKTLMMTASLLAAAGSLGAVSAYAADVAADDKDAVVVTATRSEKAVADAPATVSVITADDIEDQLSTDLKDLVRYEPGVSVRNSPSRFTAAGATTGRDGNAGFNIRGIEGNRVLMQIDGIRIPDAFSFGGQNVGRGGYGDLDIIKSVEILRGPASALYGSDGVAGAVSFFTKDPVDILRGGKVFGGQARVAYASADESNAKSLVFAGKSDTWSGMLALTAREGQEQKTAGTNDTATSARTVANPQDISSSLLFGKLVFTPAEGHRLRLTAETYESEIFSDVLSSRSATTLKLDGHDTSERTRVGLDYRWRGNGIVDAIDAVIYSQTSNSYQYTFEDRNPAVDRTRINIFDTSVVGANVDFTSRATFGSISHTLTYGFDWSQTEQESIRDGTVPPAGETFPTRAFPTTDFTRTGLFIQDEIVIGNLSLYPAARFDSYELTPKADALLTGFTPKGQDGSHVSPKLGLIYKFTPELGLFLNAGEGYKAPSPGEVNNAFANIIANYQSLPNPDLKPETSRTFEAGLRWSGARFDGSVTAFSANYDNFIEQVQVGGSFTPADPARYQFVNRSDVEISGLELRGRAELGRGFTLNVAASTAKGDVIAPTGKTALASIDPMKVAGGVHYRDGENRFGGAVMVTHAAKKDSDRLGVTCTPSCFVPDAFTTVDVTAFWNITKAVTLRAGIFNLTDEKYMWWSDGRGLSSTATFIDAYTQPGRNASASLVYRF
ncbi:MULTISPECIES: TonB-dependent hemoglobin/transferrin/lactoferrin family receptor [Asticcacaulis]|uniref:TonB-dependent hemoglobin/transferrin/lactoferrin family receptor n=1 Tax=Asticcacaulis TaxID=76890 RepID=UPI001AE935E6|nr:MULTISPECIES: TonB-dependent hemoglobin/transferrin/lactoferrin family receptor [Asticcacaulis]MBP2159178.1 hemoglobin/transferrin/lactoferrin receptor protein [Asticcacaulis solisilvae]MDR6800223.1 hemoglobin/transferrin/lactoferrin receptor protein [Asticcacaulis sp. BE141]